VLVVALVIIGVSVVATSALVVYILLAQDSGRGGASGATASGGSRILYTVGRNESAAIYVMDADGSRRREVSADDGGFYAYPSWSPDGQRIAYWGADDYPFLDDNASLGIWVAGADGTNHIRVSHTITRANDYQPTWSPDGTRVAFISISQPDETGMRHSTIHIARTDGSGIERNLALTGFVAINLRWSPSGQDLAFTAWTPYGHHGVYVISPEGEGLVEVQRDAWMAAWLPDGQGLVVGNHSTHVISIVGRDQEPQEIAYLEGQVPQDIVCSPDGRLIAVSTTETEGYDEIGTSLYIVSLQTGDVVTVYDGEEWVLEPVWSSDGDQLLYTKGEVQSPGQGIPDANMWLYHVASGELEKLTNSAGFVGLGEWSP
jgi:Tol biopolymer transport system component